MAFSYSATLHHKTHKTQVAATAFPETGALRIQTEQQTLYWRAADLYSARIVSDGSVIMQS